MKQLLGIFIIVSLLLHTTSKSADQGHNAHREYYENLLIKHAIGITFYTVGYGIHQLEQTLPDYEYSWSVGNLLQTVGQTTLLKILLADIGHDIVNLGRQIINR